ncbi:MAG TPA: VOC family protein [Terriglobales bacterium]|nr:VOC family protein [Terriglobales bacterium]
MVRGIKFVGIPVRNQNAALKFYTEALRFKIATDQPYNEKQRWIELMIPGADSLWQQGTFGSRIRRRHLA